MQLFPRVQFPLDWRPCSQKHLIQWCNSWEWLATIDTRPRGQVGYTTKYKHDILGCLSSATFWANRLAVWDTVTRLFMPQTILTFSARMKVENFKWFSLQMLRCEARAFPVCTEYGYMISRPFFLLHVKRACIWTWTTWLAAEKRSLRVWLLAIGSKHASNKGMPAV